MSPTKYDGNWWKTADRRERSGFLNGASDCLFSVAKAPWLTRSVDELDQRIDDYYKAHDKKRDMTVDKVWKTIIKEAPPDKPRPEGGEVWTGPHGYYDGSYWRQSSELENKGFLEGYIWCMRTCVKSPKENYSLSVNYYFDKIWEYVLKHPKAESEAIADLLARFRYRPSPRHTTMTRDRKTTKP